MRARARARTLNKKNLKKATSYLEPKAVGSGIHIPLPLDRSDRLGSSLPWVQEGQKTQVLPSRERASRCNMVSCLKPFQSVFFPVSWPLLQGCYDNGRPGNRGTALGLWLQLRLFHYPSGV